MTDDAPCERTETDGSATERVTIVVADDHELFRAGLVRALARRPGVLVLSDVADGARALADARALRPQIVLADARMPVLDGLDVARAVAADADLDGTSVVLLSARHDRCLTDDAAAAGAIACLDKSDSRREICDAVLALSLARRRATV